jgi:hypothetical protein
MFRACAEVVLGDVNVLDADKLNVFPAKIEMLRRVRGLGYMNVRLRVKNAQSKNHVPCCGLNAPVPLAVYGNFAFHVMVGPRATQNLLVFCYVQNNTTSVRLASPVETE